MHDTDTYNNAWFPLKGIKMRSVANSDPTACDKRVVMRSAAKKDRLFANASQYVIRLPIIG